MSSAWTGSTQAHQAARRRSGLGDYRLGDGSLLHSSPHAQSSEALLNPTTSLSPTPNTNTSIPYSPRPSPHLRAQSSTTDLHVHAHGKALHDHNAPIGAKHLFRFPVVRQFIGPSAPTHPVLYRGEGERAVEKSELLFDLVFVGLVHVLAEAAVHDVSGLSAVKFIFLFAPAWWVWLDMRSFTNESGVDDIPQRIYMVIIMILLVGYGGNAAGIEIEDVDKAEEGADGLSPTSSSGHRRFRARDILIRAEAAEGNHETSDAQAEDGQEEGDGNHSTVLGTKFELPVESHPAIQWAVTFFLIAKGFRLLLHLVYAVYLPRFRVSQFVNGLSSLVIMFILLPLLFVRDFPAVITLSALAILVGIGWRFIIGAVLSRAGKGTWVERHLARGKHCIVAKNMEHLIERNAGFVVLVIGESIMNIFYEASPDAGDVGFSSKFGRAALGVVVSSAFAFTYFDNDSGRVFRHALRIHWLTSLTYDGLHLPLTSSFVLMSAAMKHMVADSEMTEITRYYFGITCAIAMLSLAFMGFLHRSRDLKGSSRVPRSWRLAGRCVVAVIFALLPAVLEHISSTAMLGLYAGLLVAQLVFETFGKVGALPDPEPFQGVGGEIKRKNTGKRWLWGGDKTDGQQRQNSEFSLANIAQDEKSALSTGADGEVLRTAEWAERIAGGDGYGSTFAFGHHQGDVDAEIRDPHSHPPPRVANDPTAFQATSSPKPFLLQGRYGTTAPAGMEYHRDELTANEMGEDDLGLDEGLGSLKAVRIERRQVFAYAA